MRLKSWRRISGGEQPEPGKSISQRSMKDWSPGCTAGFFGVFLLAGLGFLLIFAVPAYRSIKAKATWTAATCEILSSDVASHSGSDGATYSIEATYRYTFDGVEYTSDRYGFLGGSSSGYEGKQKKVDAMPPGASVPCYVDPDDPAEAVLFIGFSWVYLFSLLPLVFIAIGGGGVAWTLFSSRVTSDSDADLSGSQLSGEAGELYAQATSFRQSEPWTQPVDSGPVELEEHMSPLGKLGCLLLITLFWNGIVSVFVWRIWSEWRAGHGIEGCLAIFMIPFVLVGLGLLVAIPYQLLALANPRPKLTLSRSAIALGESAQLSWAFAGSAHRLDDLRIWVEGVESASYRRGTNTHTDTEIFESIDVAQRGYGTPLATGSVTVRIPRDSMHSFEAGSNKILWKLKLHGSIARWPDVMTEFPLVVLPVDGDDR